MNGVDLAPLAALVSRLPTSAREGFVMGRTACKNAVAAHLACSEAEAELLVDTMVGRGLLRFEKAGDGPGVWRVDAPPA
jgi:hypothetical protein